MSTVMDYLFQAIVDHYNLIFKWRLIEGSGCLVGTMVGQHIQTSKHPGMLWRVAGVIRSEYALKRILYRLTCSYLNLVLYFESFAMF